MSHSPHSRGTAIAIVAGVIGVGTFFYFGNQKAKAVDKPASLYQGEGASKPLSSAADHTSDARMNSKDVREHVSGGGKP